MGLVMLEHVAQFYMPNEWTFNVERLSQNEWRLYPARDHRGCILDLTRCNRYKTALIATFDHFPVWDEVFEATKDWHADVNYMDDILLEWQEQNQDSFA